jgi:hypothetical protein
VPHRRLSRALHDKVEPSIWWLLLRGVSPKRLELLTDVAPKAGETKKQALKLLKMGRVKDIGAVPGVYEAPEKAGLHVTQMLFTIALGLLALLIAFGVTRFIPFSF